MRQLKFYLENPFDDKNISIDELLAFSTDHLQRMVANNPGALFNTRITATTTKLAAVELGLTDDQVKLGLRKGKKLVKDTFRKNLPKNVEKIWAVVVAQYGSESAQVLECFPLGRAVFSTSGCTDDHLENHLQTMLTGVIAHQAELGATVVSNAGGLLSTWIAVYTASEVSTGAKSMTQAGKKTAQENLQLELFYNLLEIAKAFPRQPEKLDLFMQQSLLEDHPAEPEPPAPPTP
jgi:hypothetical protein